MSSRRYPDEFKVEAVKQVTERGRRVKEVAEHLGVSQHSLYAWIRRYPYFVGRTSVIADRKKGGMMAWRDRLFAFMVRNTQHETALYQIPASRVTEIGLQLGI